MRLTRTILVLLILAVTSPAFGAALHEAVVTDDIAEVKRLIEAGADVTAKTKYGNTSLHFAAENGDTASIMALVEAGADVGAKFGGIGHTPLHLAALSGHVASIKVFLNAGAKSEWDGRTPLHFAAGGGGIDSVEALLEAWANPNVPNKDGDTPLDVAERHNHTEVIKLLKGNRDSSWVIFQKKVVPGTQKTPLFLKSRGECQGHI